ncbi:ATP-dependent DNA helicase [Methanospirillum stamsii]|uniref:ATP-dependent DNA helicase Hel308 n=1 Tax=Methanospirillum stamsii TaxID=1277351 RepID=A0A2V2MS64_9EURY|nr:ATP-dependent DNA helicase [Methanospirillum stamsii]PWR71074.1 extensin [Methanospirillum stamsii]
MDIQSLPLPEPFIRACKNKGITSLYPPQAECVHNGLLEGKNLLISIPTASGKTLLAEMAMWSRIGAGGKCLYIVPLRALAAEKYDEFSKKGVIRVGIATGDFDRTDSYLGDNDIIVATSEKTDSLLRNKTPWLSRITCIILDEVHLIGSENRGATLEMVITKLRYTNPGLQVIGLSATIGNPGQLAEWLDAKLVTSSWRPVDLKQGVYYDGKIRFAGSERPVHAKTKHDDLNLCLDTIEEGGQCLVFVSSRRNAEGFAKKAAGALKAGTPDTRELGRQIRKLRDRDEGNLLADCVEKGAAFHHAGLLRQERAIIEEGFRNGFIEVISATPTLAAGLNLPARRVIIRDYSRFSSGLGMVPIPVGEYHQMAGRAGRPHLDPYGEAVLIAKDAPTVERLFDTFIDAETERIDSQCVDDNSLCAHILSLIATGFASDEQALTEFMNRTFYVHQHPKTRSLPRIISDAIRFLTQAEMIHQSEQTLSATSLGNLVSRLYLNPCTARLILENLKPGKTLTLIGLLHVICVSPDMQRLYLKSADTQMLRTFLFKHNDDLILPLPFEQEEEELWLSGLKTALVLGDWADEISEKQIEERYGIGAGDLYNIVDSGKWLLHATERLVSTHIPELGKTIATLATRVHHGIKAELLPLITLRNIGRVRARTLFNAGYPDPESVAKAGVSRIARLIGEGIARQVIEEISGVKKSGKSGFEAENKPEYKPQKLTDIPGIGPKIAQKLQNEGINTISDLLTADKVSLSNILGSARTEKILAILSELTPETGIKAERNESPLREQKITGQSSWEDFGC